MKYELNKEDLINLIKGTCPSYELQKNEDISKLGDFSDIHGWRWKVELLKNIREDELYSLYCACVGSWKRT